MAEIYAEKIKAIEDSSVDAYDILAQTEIDEKSRYYTLNVYFVPGHTKKRKLGKSKSRSSHFRIFV